MRKVIQSKAIACSKIFTYLLIIFLFSFKHLFKVSGDTLVISGNGETEEAIEYGKEVKESKIKKLIIKEGITTTQKLRLGLYNKSITIDYLILNICFCHCLCGKHSQSNTK